ncbi:MAG TPA: alpha/beta fold hydrolase [Gemmatimonadaceae bacterium]|nr:alpha/beta fold hydrolase [Gemmatimonadaceae bacterium]
MRGEFLDVDGARLYYYAAGTRGAGEPVVFLHGFPTSSHLWQTLIPLMPAGRRLVVVDLLGYGRSDRPNGRDMSVRGHAERVLAVLDQLGINRACVVGHDVGGGIAQSLAVRHPARVSHLCLIDSVAFDDWPVREVKLARAMLPLTRYLPPTWLLSVVRADLLRGYTDEDHGARSIAQYLRPFSTPEGRDGLMEHLAALDCDETLAIAARFKDLVQPTAIVWGAHDPWLPQSLATKLHEAIPHSTIDLIENGRHFTPEEAPDRVVQSIRTLLER